LDRPFRPFAEVIAAEDFQPIQNTPGGEFGQEVDRIVAVKFQNIKILNYVCMRWYAKQGKIEF
jgi:hypothetical protein